METTKELNRIEIIFALAQYCHPSWYHSILNWPTKWLNALLGFYQASERKQPKMLEVKFDVKVLNEVDICELDKMDLYEISVI